jgi:dihydrofolate reductase/thymidylate synthase
MNSTVDQSNFKYHIICAHSYPEFGIGFKGQLPWTLKGDLLNFKSITTALNALNFVVMGRATYDSLPVSIRPLPNRFNIVITHDSFLLENNNNPANLWFSTWENLQSTLQDKYIQNQHIEPNKPSTDVFIIGGEEIYKLALATLPITTAYITEVYANEKKNVSAFDKFFPVYDTTSWQCGTVDKPLVLALQSVSKFHCEKDIYYRYLVYKTNTPPGMEWQSEESRQYLKNMQDILDRGDERIDRTTVGTISLFHTVQRYDLSDTFPICTTKRMFFRAIFEELALYISGRTDNKILQDKGIHIWDGNTTREFLDKRGLNHYPEGDMGETYGFNFRHYGAKYGTCKDDLPLDGSVGYDQIANIIHLLKTDPASRRMIINLWNPATQHNAALPACFMMYQFHVHMQRRTLNCQLYLRSSDYFLANNWNICTGALLVHMLCKLEGIDLVPGELIIVTGDTHLYKTHLSQVRENLGRKPYPFPALQIKGDNRRRELTDFVFEDFRLIGYKSHPGITADMAV